jgi:5-hydroxyisourate hydrolase
MAIVSSHILNSADGSHAQGCKVRLINLVSGEIVFEAVTDPGGRIKQQVAIPDPDAEYELAFDAGAYWAACGNPTRLTEIVLRFRMPQPDETYHSPIILSPNGYSAWVSG